MKTLHTQIVEKFLERLQTAKHVDRPKVDALRDLLAQVKKPKADDFVNVFSGPAAQDVK